MYWSRRLTRLELALYSSVIGIVALVFLERGSYYMELAERTAVEVTIANVNSALAVQVARGLISGKNVTDAPNPFRIFDAPPNYLGEFDHADLETAPRGAWLFDRARHELVYLPRHRRLIGSAWGVGAVRFRYEREGLLSKLVHTSKE